MFRAALEVVHQRSQDKKLTVDCLGNQPDDRHPVPWYGIASCPQHCKRNLCHNHALIIRRSHASEGILVPIEADDNYHDRHSGSGRKGEPLNDKWHFNKVFGKSYRRPGSSRENPATLPSPAKIIDLPSRLRLGWAALTYQACRPLNDRSRLGWYDLPVCHLILILRAVHGLNP